MRISVALATYNGSRYIGEQLESLARQTVLPDELVVSDDGSTDDTIALIRAFGEHAPFRVEVLGDHPRLGFADNFLHAIAHCSGDVVALADQDDVWLPRKLELGLSRLTRDGSLLAIHQSTLTNADLAPISLHEQGIETDAVMGHPDIEPQTNVWGNTMTIRRELLTLVDSALRPRQPGQDRPLAHDHWIYVLAAALGKVSHIAEPLILYRQHAGNVFGVVPSRLMDRIRVMCAKPAADLRDAAEFNDAMASLLAEAGRKGAHPLASAAREAAGRFARRGAHFADRAGSYIGPTLLKRARAYRSMLRSLGDDPAPTARRRYLPAAKDLVLGVAGMARIVGRALG